MYACNGILFNHESPIRGETFVTRKITRALARIALGLQPLFYLGNMDSKRDWGHARDYIEMQWLMLQQEAAHDYVIATGVQYSVRNFVEQAALHLGITLAWHGEGVNEVGLVETVTREVPLMSELGTALRGPGVKAGDVIVRVDPRYFRPTEVESLLGDAEKARKELGWTPQTSFAELVAEMVSEDLKSAARDHLVTQHGFNAYSYHE